MESLYILTNPSMPDLVKIGRTDGEVKDRAAELSSSTGVPTKFEIFRAYPVQDSKVSEETAHLLLADYRVNGRREFFRIDPHTAGDIIEKALSDIVPEGETAWEKEDELIRQAVELAKQHRRIWPSMISGHLHLSFAESEKIFSALIGRGLIGREGDLIRWRKESEFDPHRDRPAQQEHVWLNLKAEEPKSRVDYGEIFLYIYGAAIILCLLVGAIQKSGGWYILGVFLFILLVLFFDILRKK